MVKRQREKQYNTAREQRQLNQQRGGSGGSGAGGVQKRIPFNHCALSLVPYTQPVCTRIKCDSDNSSVGIVFDNASLLPFVMKHKIDPVTGQSITSRDIITLNVDREEDHEGNGKNDNNRRWQCPIIMKPLVDHMKIVAIVQPSARNEANVYSYEAYREFNVKARNYEDLMSGEKFDKNRDVIILNDPENDELNRLRDMNNFYHIRHARDLKKEVEQSQQGNTNNVKHSKTASRIMEQLEKKKKQEEVEKDKKKKKKAKKEANGSKDKDKDDDGYVHYVDKDGRPLKVLAMDVTGVEYTTSIASTSFTSTGVAQEKTTSDRYRFATDDEILDSLLSKMKKMKKKGYVRMETSLGSITFELHCDICPRTCYNFIGLCFAGKYDNTTFHRLIPNFMIQGGKAIDDDKVDGSVWGMGQAFKDEFDDRLKHSGGGILSMANAGPHTNQQQFFMTFKSCPHLDRKHTVFGKMVNMDGGNDSNNSSILSELEQIPTDKKDRPKREIQILSTDIIVDPVAEAKSLEQQRLQKLIDEREKRAAANHNNNKTTKTMTTTKTAPQQQQQQKTTSGGTGGSCGGVGRYLKGKLTKKEKKKADQQEEEGEEEVLGGGGDVLPTFSAASNRRFQASAAPPPTKKAKFGNFDGW